MFVKTALIKETNSVISIIRIITLTIRAISTSINSNRAISIKIISIKIFSIKIVFIITISTRILIIRILEAIIINLVSYFASMVISWVIQLMDMDMKMECTNVINEGEDILEW